MPCFVDLTNSNQRHVADLQARITELELENARLKSQSAITSPQV